MSLQIEAIRNSVLGPREELSKPSPLSIRIRETNFPGRELLADTLERARFCALGPINFARGLHESAGMHPVAATFGAMGLPIGIGLMTMLEPINAPLPLAVVMGGVTYMIEGYFTTNQSRIDDTFSRAASRVATFFRRPSVSNLVI